MMISENTTFTRDFRDWFATACLRGVVGAAQVTSNVVVLGSCSLESTSDAWRLALRLAAADDAGLLVLRNCFCVTGLQQG